jgi:hypothetical protein
MNTHTLPSFPLLVYECVTRYLLCVHFQGETPHWNRSTIECDERLLITRSTTKAIERGRDHLDVYKRRYIKKKKKKKKTFDGSITPIYLQSRIRNSTTFLDHTQRNDLIKPL